MLAVDHNKRSGSSKSRASRGLRALLPDEMLERNAMIETIRRVSERYGFVPLQTPAIESSRILNEGTGQDTQEIYRVVGPEHEREALGLRFDLTVSLARFIAESPWLPRPFRRYQEAPVWRAEEPGKGRFREFTQFDLDTVHAESEVADTEIIAAMCDTLDALAFGKYVVRYSSRAILRALLEYAGIPQTRAMDVFHVLDNLDKVDMESVRRELTTGYRQPSGQYVQGLGLQQTQVHRIETFLRVKGSSRADVIAELKSLFGHTYGADEAIDTIERISRNLAALGYGDDRVAVDLSVARGLAYYTGPVFEAHAVDAPQFGSIFGGGRYDDLISRFLGERVPATGASIGVDRLLEVLRHLRGHPTRKATARVLVMNIDHTLGDQYLQMTWALRRAAIPAELYLGSEPALAAQLNYADGYGVPIVVICGRHEHKAGKVTLKKMTDRTQIEIARTDLIEKVSAVLREMEDQHV